jgi:hypothetical protein
MFQRMALVLGLLAILGTSGCVIYGGRPHRVVVVRGCR